MLCSVLAAGLLISAHFERREAPAPRETPTLGCLWVFHSICAHQSSVLGGEGAGSATSSELL